jgi:hypothetical protein
MSGPEGTEGESQANNRHQPDRGPRAALSERDKDTVGPRRLRRDVRPHFTRPINEPI